MCDDCTDRLSAIAEDYANGKITDADLPATDGIRVAGMQIETLPDGRVRIEMEAVAFAVLMTAATASGRVALGPLTEL